MKPIEPGCLALVVKSSAGNTGKTVRVSHFLGTVPELPTPKYSNVWYVSPKLRSSRGEWLPYANESQLMRIDDMDFSDEVEEERCEILERTK